ncbi:hypothetical protein D9M68_708860 [compost metagenome]
MPVAASVMAASPVNQKASSGKLLGNTTGWVSSNTPGAGSRLHMKEPGTRLLWALDRHRSRARPWLSWYQAGKKPLASVRVV